MDYSAATMGPYVDEAFKASGAKADPHFHPGAVALTLTPVNLAISRVRQAQQALKNDPHADVSEILGPEIDRLKAALDIGRAAIDAIQAEAQSNLIGAGQPQQKPQADRRRDASDDVAADAHDG